MDYNIIQGACTLTNSGDNFVGTLPINIPSYVNNGIYIVRMSATNTTTSPTLNLNGLGPRTITAKNGAGITIGQMSIDSWFLMMFVSANVFVLLTEPIIYRAIYTPNALIGTTRQTVTITVSGALTTDIVVTNINDDMRADFVTASSYFLDMQAYVSAPNTVTLTYILSGNTTFGSNSSIKVMIQR